MGEGGSPGGVGVGGVSVGGVGGARLSHTSEKHPRAILGELSALRRHRELCDVVLNVANRKLFAHRYTLSKPFTLTAKYAVFPLIARG